MIFSNAIPSLQGLSHGCHIVSDPTFNVEECKHCIPCHSMGKPRGHFVPVRVIHLLRPIIDGTHLVGSNPPHNPKFGLHPTYVIAKYPPPPPPHTRQVHKRGTKNFPIKPTTNPSHKGDECTIVIIAWQCISFRVMFFSLHPEIIEV